MAKKILIVDDEQDTLDLVKLILESEGYDVLTAQSGTEALEKTNQQPDLILLDIMMPEMGGWEIYGEIKNKHDIPIVMLTAKSRNIDKMIGLHIMNTDEYITKPFKKSEIIKKIEKLLKK